MGFSLLEKSSIAPGVMKNEGDTTDDTSLAKFFSWEGRKGKVHDTTSILTKKNWRRLHFPNSSETFSNILLL